MGDPITTTIISTAFSAFSQYRQAQAQRANLKYQAAVNRNNSIYQQQAEERNIALAEDARKRGETEVYRQRLRTKQVAAEQQSAFAAGGVDLSVGSPVDLIGDIFQLGELDALTISNNADREAGRFEDAAFQNRVNASNYDAQSNLLSSQASGISPAFAAFGSILDGATSLSNYWQKLHPPETIYWNGGGTTTINRSFF